MKKITLLFAFLISFSAVPQDVFMQNGTVNQCSGNFYDSGGSGGSYGSNQNFVLTICPENPGQLVQLNFTAFNTQLGDELSIYNGNSTAAPLFGVFSGGGANVPGIVIATADNTTGCLTLEFVSDASGATNGWEAVISCFTPCQTINAQLDSANPTPNGDGYIRVCPNDPITLTGSGTFSTDGAGASYEWDLGDGNTITGQTATFSYAIPGVYIVNLNVNDTNTSTANPLGCTNSNLINQVIQVATEPDFTGTQALEPIICFEDSTTIEGIVTPVEFINDCTPPEGTLTFLPDGSGGTYETSVLVDCYDAAQTLSNINQLVSICVTMEHSYLGDLFIDIVSPNGQTVRMHNRGGGSANLGIPWSEGAVDLNSTNTTPGVGYQYCFVPGNANPTLVGGILSGGVFPNGNGPGTYTDTYVPAGNYSSVNPLTGLVGSPLNGSWRIRITDNAGLDNGFIFAWSIEFDPSLQPPELSFTPVITSESWDADPTITNTTGNTITVNPPSAGTYCYTYRATDDFGCEYTEQVCIEKLPEVISANPNNLFICNAVAPPYNFDLTQNTSVVLGPAPAPSDLVVSYHTTQNDADNDLAPIGNPSAYPGVDGQIIYVRIEYLTSGCHNTATFTLNIISRPTINPVSDMFVCDDASNDGFASFDLESQTLGVLGTQDIVDFNVTYHTSFADADAGTGGLTSPYINTTSPQPIFVRIERDGDVGCSEVSATPEFNLIVNSLDDGSFTMTPTCDGATATVTGTMGGTFTFNPVPSDAAIINSTNGTITGGTSGATYTVEYTTTGVCPVTVTQTFSIPVIDDASFTITATCDGATASITGTTGGTFVLNPVPADSAIIDSFTGTVTGGTSGVSYTVEYLTSGTCPSSSSQSFTVISVDDASFVMTATCDGATANVTGTTGGSFTFNPVPTDAANIDVTLGTVTGATSATTYSIEYTTAGACPASSIQSFTVLTSDDSSFSMTPTCDGGTAIINGTPGGMFSFNTAPTDGAVIDAASGLVTGGTPSASYTIVYTTLGICPTSTIQVLMVLPVDDSSFSVTPTCEGATVTITGVTGGTFAFNPVPTDGASIDTFSGMVTGATPGISYTVEYTTIGNCPSTGSVNFTVNPLPIIFDPSPLVVCDDLVPDGYTSINLSINDEEITGGNVQYSVTYHLSAGEANSGMNPLPVPYTNVSNPQRVFVRVVEGTNGCIDTTELILQVEQAPIAFIPDDLEYCDPNNDGFGVFNLTDAEAQVTGGDGNLIVTYHRTLINAQNNENAIPLNVPYENIVAFTQPIYVRVVSPILTTDCATIVPLVLNVIPTPVVPLTIVDFILCDTDRDGLVQFDLTTKNAEILGSQNPSQYVLTYHLSQNDADDDIDAIVNVDSYPNLTNPQTIFVRLEGTNGCYTTGEFDLIVNLAPLVVLPTELSLCDDDVADEMTIFNLTSKDDEITNYNSNLSVNYYTTSANAESDIDAINPANEYTNTSVNGNLANPQTLYVRVTDTTTGCTSFTTLTIRVLPNPTPLADAQNMVLCDDFNTGDGVEVFDLTINSSYILDGALQVTPTYYETMEDAELGINSIADPVNYTNTNTDFTSQTIYVRVTNDSTGCYAIVDFDILVNPLPDVLELTDYIICVVNSTGFTQFDLTSKNAEVLDGQDPLLYRVSYHFDRIGADNLTGALVSPYTNVSNPQQIFVAITNTVTGCSISTPSFNIEVDNGAVANTPLAPYTICDNIGDNDGFGQFDLTTQDAEILGPLQDAANFIVSYYATEGAAEFGMDPIPYTYENTTSNLQVIYVRVDNDTPDAAGMDSSICYDVKELTLKVNLLPIFDLDESYTLCVGTNGTEVLDAPFLNTGLSSLEYTFEWSLDGNVLFGETAPNLTASLPGMYSVVVTNIVTECFNIDRAEVVISSPPTVVVVIDTQAFSEDNVITATATGDGVFEYSLDGGPWQESGTFTDVSSGVHTVIARDINGCGLAEGTVTVLDYPHFFTPNGDGRNETWNIVGFDQTNTKIYIFDRFGKLLKQISPSGKGWDGTFNGRPVPTNDYWFTVEYTEDGQPKQFMAHFTLKR